MHFHLRNANLIEYTSIAKKRCGTKLVMKKEISGIAP